MRAASRRFSIASTIKRKRSSRYFFFLFFLLERRRSRRAPVCTRVRPSHDYLLAREGKKKKKQLIGRFANDCERLSPHLPLPSLSTARVANAFCCRRHFCQPQSPRCSSVNARNRRCRRCRRCRCCRRRRRSRRSRRSISSPNASRLLRASSPHGLRAAGRRGGRRAGLRRHTPGFERRNSAVSLVSIVSLVNRLHALHVLCEVCFVVVVVAAVVNFPLAHNRRARAFFSIHMMNGNLAMAIICMQVVGI